MSGASAIDTRRPFVDRWFPTGEWVLLVILAVEVVVFGTLNPRFVTATNFFEVVRMSVELGLLALALTLVIVTGGIDLSVGSTLALCAVLFGRLCSVERVHPLPAALVAVAVGAACGGANALLITRLRVPALIVTLGTWSLYRGLAEGLTGAIVNYSDFPSGFLAFGQGYWLGFLPCQLPLFAAAAAGFWVLLTRTVFGRGLYAIGCSTEAARHAGVPVRCYLTSVYVLAGAMSGLAAVVYAARLGQAKADAGTGYELMAITAVVLGGTSIFGGRGTIGGTLLGLLVIVILENGLRLAALPAELAGILTGALMIGAIAAHRWSAPAAGGGEQGAFVMKNSQVAALSAAILLAAVIVAVSNGLLARRLATFAPPTVSTPAASAPAEPTARVTVAMMPKSKGDPYFISCREGAERAAKELGVELLWDGPTETDPSKQNDVVETWITKGVDVIAVSVENQQAISTVLRKARSKGIGVLTWDADAERDARDFLINQATPEGIGTTLTDEAARILGGRGEFAIVTASLTAANQNEWIRYIKARLADKYPELKLAVIRPSDGLQDRAYQETQNILKAYPNVKLIMAIAAPAVPGAGEAVQQSGRRDVKVIGLSLPSMCRELIHAGVIECIVLWKTVDLGYLTVYAAKALHDGTLRPGVASFPAGSLGTVAVEGDEVLLGPPFVFTAENVDQFDF